MANTPRYTQPDWTHDWGVQSLIITIGIPGSGKSTWAQRMVDLRPHNVVRVNRDDIRVTLGFIYDPKREDEVTKIQDEKIHLLLSAGYTVIVDDTHLNPKYRVSRQVQAKQHNVEYCVNDTFLQVPVRVCIDRDRTRGVHSVGKDVIEELYYKWWKGQDKPLNIGKTNHLGNEQTAIICDLDGTLAMIPKGASPYKRDFLKDTLNPAVADLLNSNSDRHAILITSGREAEDYEASYKWLVENRMPFAKLIMRATGDSRPDTIVKKELYMNNIQGKYRVIYVVDDRPSVVRMWRAELGLTVFQPAPNIEF